MDLKCQNIYHLASTNIMIMLNKKKSLFKISRTIFAVYEMVGSEADQSKAEELFNRLDLNSDGSISQVRKPTKTDTWLRLVFICNPFFRTNLYRLSNKIITCSTYCKKSRKIHVKCQIVAIFILLHPSPLSWKF